MTKPSKKLQIEALEKSIEKWNKLLIASRNTVRNPCACCTLNQQRNYCPLKKAVCDSGCIVEWYKVSRAITNLIVTMKHSLMELQQ